MNAVGRWFRKPRSKKRWALYGIGAFVALIVVLALVVPAPDETTSAPEADEPDATEPETTTEADETTTQAPEPSNVVKLREAFEDTDLLGEDLSSLGSRTAS
jgi:flagellar biosynthesis/type III secretory pathway M-ring protein FliF/YscJ